MEKKLIILESSVIGPKYIDQAAKSLGWKAIFYTGVSNQEGDALKEIISSKFISCDTLNPENIKYITRSLPESEIVGITTFLDSRIEVAVNSKEDLLIPGIDSKAKDLKDKNYVNKLIPEHIPNSFEFNGIKPPVEKLVQLFEKSQNGIAIKPAFAAGGKGFKRIQDIKDVYRIDEIYDSKLPKNLRPHILVAQEFLEGELISFEGFVVNGDVTFLGITGRGKIGNTESFFQFPYNENIPPKVNQEGQNIIKNLVSKSGFKNGCFHAEFVTKNNVIKLIDANFGRPAGANIIELIAFSYEVEPWQIYRNILSVTLKGKVTLDVDLPRKLKKAISIAYGISCESLLIDIEDVTNSAKHTIAQNLGHKISAMGDSNWSWIGLISGEQKDVLERVQNLKLHTSQGIQKPVFSLKGN